MRTSILYFLGFLSLCSAEISAQRQQVTEFYRPPLDIPMEGKITYSYIVGKDGDNIKDGPLSIKASINNFQRYVQLQKMTINGNYNLTANYKNGNMNGALTLNSRTTYTHGSRSQVESFTLNGNFKDGIPNGNFVANYVTTVEAKMNVNYNNGKLVGPYMVDYSTALVDREAIKGTLTQNGELTGRWDFNYIDERFTYTFLKGVRLSSSGKDSSTPPALVEKARQFANGTITEEKLRGQGIMVFEDSIDLGIHTNRIILRDNVISFRDLRGCDFSTPNFKKFKYLEKVEYLTDEGFDYLIRTVRNAIVRNEYNINDFGTLSSSNDHFERVIGTDDKGLKYVKAQNWIYHLTTIGEFKGKLYDKVYLTKEKAAALPGKIDEIKRETAVGLMDFLKIAYENEFDRKFGIMKRFDSANPTIKDITQLYDNLSTVRMDTLQTTADKEFMILETKTGVFYVKKSAADELENYKTKLLNLSKDYFTKLYQQNITIDYNESIIGNIKNLDSILQSLNYLVNKSSTSMAYNDYAYKYFCTDGVEDQELWKLELGKRIKKFTKITHIRLTGIDNDTVYCEFTKKGKEVYQTSVKIKDNKILVTSIDFEGAKLISGE
ncbi:hypothetical protein H6A66_03815 [Bacteroides caecigallinarum]|uniref:hypothetical protein n=1 Tax=Bacteroides caecigallinarum TaxID=1411144 RepID=UPI00195A5A3C|nr:hypothetical protein [Bacteroides caecigallinarum]MBM6864305.1 hypothetical protein [Bacteroides caecigallinarum]